MTATFFSLQFTISHYGTSNPARLIKQTESVRCERAAQDRLIIALLEIRKVSAAKQFSRQA